MTKKHEDIKELALQIEKMKKEPKGIYVVNEKNMEKFESALDILSKIAKDNHGKVISVDRKMEDLDGCISVEIPMLNVYSKKIHDVSNLVSLIDTIEILPSANEELFLNVTVNDIWTRIKVELK